MPRKKSTNIISDILTSADTLKKDISTLPDELRDKIKELALAIVAEPKKKRGRPLKKKGKPKKRGKSRKQKAKSTSQI